jgi:hypothetical protein
MGQANSLASESHSSLLELFMEGQHDGIKMVITKG